jgi:hypothetical protein
MAIREHKMRRGSEFNASVAAIPFERLVASAKAFWNVTAPALSGV